MIYLSNFVSKDICLSREAVSVSYRAFVANGTYIDLVMNSGLGACEFWQRRIRMDAICYTIENHIKQTFPAAVARRSCIGPIHNIE